MRISGIDTGAKGAIVMLDSEDKTAFFYKLKYRSDGAIDNNDIRRAIAVLLVEADNIYLERTKGRGGWGALQNYSMGANFGRMQQIVSSYPYELVEPKTWQKYAHEGLAGKGKTAKIKTKAAFIMRNPSCEILDDNIIDAFFIARYGLVTNHVKFHDDWNFISI